MNFKITSLTMAITHMEAMLKFYSEIFNIKFEEMGMYGAKLYSGTWGQLGLLFCPAELAQNTATQNRHQFDIEVEDLDALQELVLNHGGELMGEVVEDERARSLSVYDPDNNSIVFKQPK